MKQAVFQPADILVPHTADMADWSVIACDQFTAERAYWDRVTERVRGKLSTLHMVLPEAYLADRPVQDVALEKNEIMEHYLAGGIFDVLRDSFVYVERRVSGGVRHGLVGKLDLEAYDYAPERRSPVRASERTVEERLPPRVTIRAGAPLEMPHVMVLIDDPAKSVVEPLRRRAAKLPRLYDFDLMEDGGHIAGYAVSGAEAERVAAALASLADREIQMIVGDGNHSLAAAKECWNLKKRGLTEAEQQSDPARYALVEVVNVYDEGVRFEPIHRAVWCADEEKLMECFREKLASPSGRYRVTCVHGGREETLTVRGRTFGAMMAGVQEFVTEYVAMNDGVVDYIHDDASARRMAQEGAAVFLLPVMDKADFFSTVAANGIFPEKSFSIGHARDKRYYLECRQIR